MGAVLAWRTGAGREVGRYMLVLCTFRVCFLLCVRVPDILALGSSCPLLCCVIDEEKGESTTEFRKK